MIEGSQLEVKDSQEFGRFVIAKREYGSRELILDEEPLLIYPVGKKERRSSSQPLTEDINTSTLNCLGCFKFLTVQTVQYCTKCFWPVCCKACAAEPVHANYECLLFTEKKIIVSDEGFRHLDVLRAVLMCRNEEKSDNWDHFASLLSSYTLKQDNYLARTADQVKSITEFLRQCFQLNVDPQLIDKIMGICNVNAFEITGKDQQGNAYAADAIYSFGSMFAHGCAPNCDWVIIPHDYNGIKKWHLRVYSRRKIHRNEPISITYVPHCFASDITERRSYIAKTLKFNCKCNRCLDSTELSFYTEAIKCPSCGDEKLIADNPIDVFSNWTCSQCRICQDYRFAKKCVGNFDPSFIWKSPSPTALEMCLISSNEKCRLSESHREIILTTLYWIEERSMEKFQELLLPSTGRNESFVNFLKLTTKCRKALGMFGSLTDIVELEWYFARIIASFYFKTLDFSSTPYDPYLPEEKLKILTAICAHLKISHDIVEWSPFKCLYAELRYHILVGYTFWKDQLRILKATLSANTRENSNELIGDGVRVKGKSAQLHFKFKGKLNKKCDEMNSEPKTSPITKEPQVKSELSTEAVKMKRLDVSESSDLLPCDDITSPTDPNSALMKPPVDLLNKWDFYFDE